jgi:type IV pilus assembly protein PilB
MTLVQQLIKKGVLDKSRAAALEYEIKTSNETEEEVILKKEIISEEALFDLKSKNLKIPLKAIDVEDISLSVLETIPEESSRYYKMVPLTKEDNFLEIGMISPEDLKAREALEFLARQSNFKYKIFLITLSNFNKILRKYRTLRKEVTGALEQLETEIREESIDTTKSKEIEFNKIVEDAPISKVVAVILKHAVEGGASDIHIEPVQGKVRVRFRLDGVLHSSIFLPFKVLPSVVARIKILATLKIDETRVPQDGRFSTKIKDKIVDFRVSTLPTVLGEKVVIRILDPSQRKITFEDLGMTGRNLKILEEAIKNPFGMILSTGPTGSGKTTSLYTVLGVLNQEGVNVMTLEDPVEYVIEGVNQSQVRPEIDYGFASGLRHMVRQDPDVIMVGEIRDAETASLAIHAALTGHLVLSTLHTTNALGVIPRLLDMGIDQFLLPFTLNVAIGQRLTRKLCLYCRKKVKATGKIKNLILEELKNIPLSAKKEINESELYIYQPVGCKKCNQTGYSGRIGVFEILKMTDSLAQIILKEPSEMEIQKEARKQEMITMRQDGILKALKGLTSVEEILRVCPKTSSSVSEEKNKSKKNAQDEIQI